MFCMNCGKQIRDGARFCPYCGADQSDAVPASAPAPAAPTAEAPQRRQAPSPASRSAKAAPKKKKNRTGLVIGLLLLLAVLAVGGYFGYQKIIFPKTVVKDAELLVSYLETSPQRDNWQDFELRAEFDKHNYSYIAQNREARLKVKDYLRTLYERGDYAGWAHSMALLQDAGLFWVSEETSYVIDKADVEDLFNRGGPVNINGGWYGDVYRQQEVYDEYPGFRNTENFDVYNWGDFFAVRSHEYGWNLFYRGWKLKEIEPARWSATGADDMRYILQTSRVINNLLIVPFDYGFSFDAYLVMELGSGESFLVYYD